MRLRKGVSQGEGTVRKRFRGVPFWKRNNRVAAAQHARDAARHGWREARAGAQSPLDFILEAMKDVF